MALAEIGRALTGAALDSAKNSVVDAIKGDSPKPAQTASAPAQTESIGAVMLGQVQAMQKALKEDQELIVQYRAGEEMLRITEIFVPSPNVFVLSGNDGQQRLTRIVSAAANLQLICKVLRVAPGVAPTRLKIMAPSAKPAGQA